VPKDGLDVRSGDVIQGLDDQDLTLIVHEALNAIGDGEAAVGACVGWAVASERRGRRSNWTALAPAQIC
jgi:hypothetical protein